MNSAMSAGTLRSIFLAFFNFQQIQKQKRDGRWKSLTKREIANQISNDDIPYRTALKVIDCFFDIVRQAVKDGDDVAISNFGTFTSKPTKLCDWRVPTFIPSHKFKQQINK